MTEATEPVTVPRKKGGRRRLLRWTVTIGVVGLVGYFFVRSLARNWDRVAEEHLAFDPWWILATVLFALAVPLTGILCGRMIMTLQPGARVTTSEAVAVQCASWLLKYIPGQVGSVVNKVVWAGKKGISRTIIVITFIYENVFLQIVSIVPSVVILAASLGPGIFGDNVTTLLLPVLALVPLGLVLWRPFFHRLVNLPAKRVLKQPVPRESFLSSSQTLRYLVGFVGPRILNGVGFVLIAHSVADIGPSDWLPFAAAYTLAGAVGILAVLVPSGLGVREAVIVVVLSQYVSTPEAIVISLLARLCSTIGDAVIALIYAVVRQRIDKEIRP